MANFGEHYKAKLADKAATLTIAGIGSVILVLVLIFFGGAIWRGTKSLAWELSGGKAATEAVSKAGKAIGQKAGEYSDKTGELARKAGKKIGEEAQEVREKASEGADWVREHGAPVVDKATQAAKSGLEHARGWKDSLKERFGHKDQPEDHPSTDGQPEQK